MSANRGLLRMAGVSLVEREPPSDDSLPYPRFWSLFGAREESWIGSKGSPKHGRPEYSARIITSILSKLRPSWGTRMKPHRWRMRRPVWLSVLYLLFMLAKGYGLDPSRRISQYGHTLWRTQD